ncbi:hypothetical protein BC940DRAFT_235281 [Gongronella butleri]|nr:hypothetical protein BC940DRAFT_235281 [Gongronella butleri]
MEKYSRWRDPGTGIQPFLPPVPPRTESSILLTLTNIIHYVLGPVQGILKFAFVLVLGLVYILLVPLLGLLLMPLPPLQRLWTRFWSSICLRLILFFAGFFLIKTEITSIRRGKGGKSSRINVKPGDIIVANWTSYIEVLYLAFRFDPVFTQVIPSVNKVRVLTLWQAVRACVHIPPVSPEDVGLTASSPQLMTLKQLQKQTTRRAIVVFPEATTTNGRALLNFASPLFDEYTATDQHGCFHGGSVSPNDVATLAGSSDLVGGLMGIALGNMARLRKTNMDVHSKREFMDYYYSRNKKDHPANSRKRR